MNAQLPLFDRDTKIVSVPRRGTIAERFADFIDANPHVVRAVVEISRTLRASGHRRIGMKYVIEVARWEYVRATQDASGFRINNNYTALFSRYVATHYADLADAFEFRTRRAV